MRNSTTEAPAGVIERRDGRTGDTRAHTETFAADNVPVQKRRRRGGVAANKRRTKCGVVTNLAEDACL